MGLRPVDRRGAPRRRRHQPRLDPRQAARGHRLRARGPAGRRAGRRRSRSPRTSCSTSTTSRPFASGIALNLGAIASTAKQRVEEFDVRTTSVLTPGRHAVRRQPAEGRGRPGAVPAVKLLIAASRPAAWTSARWSSCTSGSWPQRDEGAAVIIVSTELDEVSPWPTGSRSCTAARSSAFCPPDHPRAGARPADGRQRRRPDRTAPARRTAPEMPVQEPDQSIELTNPRRMACSERRGATAATATAQETGRARAGHAHVAWLPADRQRDHPGGDRGALGRHHGAGRLHRAGRRRRADRRQRPGRCCAPGLLLHQHPATPSRPAWHAVVRGLLGAVRGRDLQPGDDLGRLPRRLFAAIFYPLSLTAFEATPLILSGLAVAVAFRAGLFNIGAAGPVDRRRDRARPGSAYAVNLPIVHARDRLRRRRRSSAAR